MNRMVVAGGVQETIKLSAYLNRCQGSLTMSRNAPSGIVLYAKDVVALMRFYRELLSLDIIHADAYHVVLDGPILQVVIHAIPEAIARTIEVTSPPALREEQAIKIFVTVPSLDTARTVAAALGGGVHEQTWDGPGFRAVNAHDPEGNILQLRERID